MKKLLCLMVALLVVPAMATITVRIVDNENLSADIFIDADGTDADVNGSLLAGIAFDASVDGGAVITGVVAAKTGESVDGDKGYGIFMGNIVIEETSPGVYEITDPGGPVAPSTAPDNPGQLGTSAIVLEFGCLYNINVVADAPDALDTKLCTITVDQPTTLTLTLDDARGQAALIGGGPISGVAFVGGPITGGPVDCYTGPDTAQWDIVGQPDSWCTPRQCHGDADNADEVIQKGTYWVGYNDITILLAGFKQEFPNPITTDPDVTHPWIAADFDHADEVIQKGTYRVGYADIGILLGSFKSETVPTDCNP